MPTVQAIRPDREVLTRQRLPYFVGLSGETVGSLGLSMHLVVIPPGARAEPHVHRGHETGIYVLEGQVLTRWGQALEHEVVSGPGEFLFVPPDVPHEAVNLSADQPARAVIARNHPAEQDRVEPWPPRPQEAPAPLPALEVRVARDGDYPALQQMLELYQYDLSDLWPQPLDASGRYGYDLERHRRGERFHAYVACDGDQYLGFALVAPAAVTRREGCWMEQFFVLRRHRRGGIGRRLAEQVLRRHPGPWEVGQMPANLAAQAFWRRVVGGIAAEGHVELTLTEGPWQGVVQQFDVAPAG